uniref:Uncharacterized protein n=1 Tax=Rhizophora mucronata TaxID=61149 RepID=A0A2P2NGS7_RHIMU
MLFLTLPAITLQTSIALLSPSTPRSPNVSALSCALPLVAVVKIPCPLTPRVVDSLKPFLMMLHTLQCGIELHKLDDPFRPSEHANVVQWNLRSSLPSAMQRGCFLGSLLALALMVSL